ncbi:MAG: hypothetical protein C0595_03425 [Marinilabiliales bacterium]|nr:MAG: hypothetical protein C0595_03425 [Marinilabiliales bacterium]
MKFKFIVPVLILILAVVNTTNAQENKNEFKTIFNKEKNNNSISHGAYGAITIGYTQIDGKDGLQIGGRAAWVLNHHLAIGITGKGFFNNLKKTTEVGNYYLAGGYGGLFIEPIIAPKSPVHVSFPVIFGVGGLAAKYGNVWDNNYYNDNYYDTDVFLVLEPGLEVEFNVVKFMRIAIGGSYRLTNGVLLEYKYYDNNDLIMKDVPTNALDGFNFNLSFKFGWF